MTVLQAKFFTYKKVARDTILVAIFFFKKKDVFHFSDTHCAILNDGGKPLTILS